MLISEPFATVTDLEARWRTLTDTEKATAEVLLGDASNHITGQCSTANYLPDTATDAEVASRTLRLKVITVNMVKRAMKSETADGGSVVEDQVAAGPFSERKKYANPTGDLFITKAEMKTLPCGQQTAFTIQMAFDEDLS